MKKTSLLLAIIFLCLTGLAIYSFQSAYHRGELVIAIVMLFAAALFWKRSQHQG